MSGNKFKPHYGLIGLHQDIFTFHKDVKYYKISKYQVNNQGYCEGFSKLFGKFNVSILFGRGGIGGNWPQFGWFLTLGNHNNLASNTPQKCTYVDSNPTMGALPL